MLNTFISFRGTPTGLWLADELINVFGITEKLDGENAQRIYDELEEKLAQPEFRPRALFERFNIEVLCTTDAATDGRWIITGLFTTRVGHPFAPPFAPTLWSIWTRRGGERTSTN